MSTKKIEDLEPGMKVSSEVASEAGDVIVPAGDVLTVEHIEAIDAAGLKEIAVEEADDEAEESPAAEAEPPAVVAQAAILAEAEAELAPYFVLANLEVPVMKKIHEAVVMIEACSQGYDIKIAEEEAEEAGRAASHQRKTAVVKDASKAAESEPAEEGEAAGESGESGENQDTASQEGEPKEGE